MNIRSETPVSRLTTIWPAELLVLTAVTDVQADGHLSADMVKVRQKAADMDGAMFARNLCRLEMDGLIETEVWPGGWRVWATRHGWATVMEAEER